MPQIPFAFEFKCERLNDLCMAELPFGCSENFTLFLLKTAKWQTETDGYRMHNDADYHKQVIQPPAVR